jgi:mannose-6-phosphate isomerase-like protein (cupin superfamily)
MDAPVCLGPLELAVPPNNRKRGTRVFAGMVELSQRAVTALGRTTAGPVAVVSRLRGTGRGVSSSALFDALERDHPIAPVAPFEGSDRVAGAVWRGDQILGGSSNAAVARLIWAADARDLPMHVHDHSDRFIIVRRGRGFFHVSDEDCEHFTGQRVRSIPARERDVFLFTRGVVHTFSTDREPMELLSCQLPFVPFDERDQYRLPACRWTAATHRDNYAAGVACDAAWTVLARQPAPAFMASCVAPVVGS